MARLGRGRRVKAQVRRGVSAVTATPLVRKRLLNLPNGVDLAVKRATRLKRHVPLIKRARSITTVTPLIRKRLVQALNSGEVAAKRATRFKRHTPTITRNHAIPPQIFQPSKQPVTRKRVTLRATYLKRHLPELLRSKLQSVRPPRQLVKQNSDSVAARRTYFKRRARVVSRAQSTTTPTPFLRKQVFVVRDLAAARRALRGRGVTQSRSPSTPTATPTVRKRTTVFRVVTRVPYFKHRPRAIAKSRVVPFVPTQPAHQPLIRKDPRAAVRRALGWRGATPLLRAPSVASVTPLTRKRLSLSTNSNERSRYLASWLKRHAVRVARSVPRARRDNRPYILSGGNTDRRSYWRKRPRTIIRALPLPVASRRRQPLVRSESRLRLRRMCGWRGATPVQRARVTPPPAPFVRKRVVKATNTGRARQIRTHHAGRPARVGRNPLPIQDIILARIPAGTIAQTGSSGISGDSGGSISQGSAGEVVQRWP